MRGSSVKDPTPKHEKQTTSPMPKILTPATVFLLPSECSRGVAGNTYVLPVLLLLDTVISISIIYIISQIASCTSCRCPSCFSHTRSLQTSGCAFQSRSNFHHHGELLLYFLSCRAHHQAGFICAAFVRSTRKHH